MSFRKLRSKAALGLWMLQSRGFLWHFRDTESPPEFQALRRLARQIMHQRWPMYLRPFVAALSVITWPIGSFREASVLCRASSAHAIPARLHQRAWRAALTSNVPPAEYGSYGLWRDGAAPADSWLYTTESSLLTAHLTDRSVIDLAGDKVAFAEFCAQQGTLPVATTLAVFKGGREVTGLHDIVPPDQDLVTKPVRSAHAKGFDVWETRGDRFICATDPDAEEVTRAELFDHLAARGRRHPSGLLLQPRLTAHPDLTALEEKGPPVARVIT
ncbi:MAG: sugar-transfer associated ATP-grasp domain-containing protein, partial [Pseudomonadota bacterium]